MSYKKIPRRVEINRRWYDVREGWAGKLELHEYMKAPEYFATEASTVNDLWNVTDSCQRSIVLYQKRSFKLYHLRDFILNRYSNQTVTVL